MKVTRNHLLILKQLSQGLNPTQISRIIQKSQPYVTKVTKKLQEKGLLRVERICSNMNNYLLTSEGYAHLQHGDQGVPESVMIDGQAKNVRWHSLEIAIRIPPTFLSRWEQYLNRIFEIPEFRKVKLHNNEQGILQVGNIRVKTTTKSVLFYPDDIYAKDLEEGRAILLDLVVKTAEKINNTLGFPVYKRQWANIEITKQEIAYLHDPLAKKYIDSGLRAVIRIGQDKRMVIDFSKRIPETEFVHKKFAPEDARKWEEFSGDLISGQFDHKDIKAKAEANNSILETIEKENALISSSQKHIAQGQQEMTETMKLLNQYLTLHMPVFQKLDMALDPIIKQIKNAKRTMEKRHNERGQQKILYHFEQKSNT